jgi:hypothetical protein
VGLRRTAYAEERANLSLQGSHHMATWTFRPFQIAVIIIAAAFLVGGPLRSVAPASDTYVGTVQHVSTDNIKITDAKGDTISFTLIPSFDQVFSSDGKTTYQMKNLKSGDYVKILSSKGALGKRADKIIVEKPAAATK